MAVTATNKWRYRAMLVSREVKWLFMAIPERCAKAALGRWLIGPILRWMFLGPKGQPHRAGEIVLAELRRESGFSRASNFHVEPLVMAHREGKREMALWFFKHLNMDEKAVQQLMELDDGIE
jgi:hypothetical protein